MQEHVDYDQLRQRLNVESRKSRRGARATVYEQRRDDEHEEYNAGVPVELDRVRRSGAATRSRAGSGAEETRESHAQQLA